MTTLTVKVKFLANRYSGHQDTCSFPPSPARLGAALVSAAHEAFDNPAEARKTIQRLSRQEDPIILVPPTWFISSGAGYMQPILSVQAGRNAKKRDFKDRARFWEEVGGASKKYVNGHWSIVGDLYYHWRHTDLNTTEISLLKTLLRSVPYLGRECDTASLDVAAVTTAQLMSLTDSHHTLLLPSPQGEVQLRRLTPRYLSWLDYRFEANRDEQAARPPAANHRIEMIAFSQVSLDGAGESALMIQPLKEGLSVSEVLRLTKYFNTAPDRNHNSIQRLFAFPIVRAAHRWADGKVLGIGFLSNNTEIFHVTEYPAYQKLQEYFGGDGFLSRYMDERYWRRSSQIWTTSVPFIAHPDKWVARMQILSAVPGAEITELESAPIRSGQHWMSTATTQRAWHIALRTPKSVAGPIVLDHEAGSGVLVPDYGI